MGFDDHRVPEERGGLQPPRRHPPTAVATATPPPPRRPARAQHRVFRGRVLLAVLVFASPPIAGWVGWTLIRDGDGPLPTALGWAFLGLACVAAAFLTWVAGVLPIRDHLRDRAASRVRRSAR